MTWRLNFGTKEDRRVILWGSIVDDPFICSCVQSALVVLPDEVCRVISTINVNDIVNQIPITRVYRDDDVLRQGAISVEVRAVLCCSSADIGIGPGELMVGRKRVALRAEVLDNSLNFLNDLNRGIIR